MHLGTLQNPKSRWQYPAPPMEGALASQAEWVSYNAIGEFWRQREGVEAGLHIHPGRESLNWDRRFVTKPDPHQIHENTHASTAHLGQAHNSNFRFSNISLKDCSTFTV